jgi:hypothetical protein
LAENYQMAAVPMLARLDSKGNRTESNQEREKFAHSVFPELSRISKTQTQRTQMSHWGRIASMRYVTACPRRQSLPAGDFC